MPRPTRRRRKPAPVLSSLRAAAAQAWLAQLEDALRDGLAELGDPTDGELDDEDPYDDMEGRRGVRRTDH